MPFIYRPLQGSEIVEVPEGTLPQRIPNVPAGNYMVGRVNWHAEQVAVSPGVVVLPPSLVTPIADQTFLQNVAITALDVTSHFAGTAPLTFTLDATSDALPSGLTFTNGIISGTPSDGTQSRNIVVRATNSAGSVTDTFLITVNVQTNPVTGTQYYTDFDEFTAGTIPMTGEVRADFGNTVAGVQGWSFVNESGNIVCRMAANVSGKEAGVLFDRFATDATEMEIFGRVKTTYVGSSAVMIALMASESSPTQFYMIDLNTSTGVLRFRRRYWDGTSLLTGSAQTATAPFSFPSGTVINILTKFAAGVTYTKAWPDGQAEPASWQLTATPSILLPTPALAGIYSNADRPTTTWEVFSVGINGSPALRSKPTASTGITRAKSVSSGAYWPVHNTTYARADAAGTQPAVAGQRLARVTDEWGTNHLIQDSPTNYAPNWEGTNGAGYADFSPDTLTDNAFRSLKGSTTIGTSALLADSGQAFTVIGMFRMPTGANKLGSFFAKAGPSSGPSQFLMGCNVNGQAIVTLRGATWTSATSYADGQWHAMTVSWNGVSGTVEIDNGGTNALTKGITDPEPTQVITFGGRDGGNSNSGGWDYDAGSVFACDHALTHQNRQEIAQTLAAAYGKTLTVTASDGQPVASPLVGIAAMKAQTTGAHWPISDTTKVYEGQTAAVLSTSGAPIGSVDNTWSNATARLSTPDANRPTFNVVNSIGKAVYSTDTTRYLSAYWQDIVVGQKTTKLFCDTTNPTDTFTVFVAFRAPASTTPLGGSLLAKAGATSTNRTFDLVMTSAGAMNIRLRGAVTTYSHLASVADGNWHVACVTWDGTEARLKVDDFPEQVVSVGTALEETTQHIIVGARDMGAAFPWRYDLGDVIIAQSALTTALRSEVITELKNRMSQHTGTTTGGGSTGGGTTTPISSGATPGEQTSLTLSSSNQVIGVSA